MARINVLDGRQRQLIEQVLQHFENLEAMARSCGVHPRTLRDWRREKHRMSYEALQCVYKEAHLAISEDIPTLTEFWHLDRARRLGAEHRYQLYGNPGTAEGRRKGGRTSQEHFRRDPEYARKLHVRVRQDILRPHRTEALAEFIGILLGDGWMTNYQVHVAFNRETDQNYGQFLAQRFQELFGLTPGLRSGGFDDKGDVLVVSSVNLVEFLTARGFCSGDKIRNRADVPPWIRNDRNLRRACLRGLIDTDGSFYRYQHRVNNFRYVHCAICFTSHSPYLLDFVSATLHDEGLHPSRAKWNIYLHRWQDVKRYMLEIDTHNLKHLDRYQAYCNLRESKRFGEVARVDEGAGLENR